MTAFFDNFLALTLDAAPWLALGLALGGLMKSLIPLGWLERHLKGEGLGPVIKAALLGAPLPLCSCGVLPAALGLRRAGASPAATTSFLVSTPETGVDSVAVTYALLGPAMTLARPVAAIASAIAAGLLVGRRATIRPVAPVATLSANAISLVPVKSDCRAPAGDKAGDSCCGCGSNEQPASPRNAWLDGLRYAFRDLFGDILPWMLVGLLFAAAIQTWLSADFLGRWGSGLPAMLIMIAVSIPMYVCATASTPLAAGLMLAGISPGTVLVFLLAGPASNIGSLGVIRKELGQRAMTAYLGAVIGVAILSGLALDALLSALNLSVSAQIAASDHLLPAWIEWLGLAVLLAASIDLLRGKAASVRARASD